ncbi:unnamed protein product, partial [Amoebophrya sp. A25]|eukprot:GSA25T00027553001.1
MSLEKDEAPVDRRRFTRSPVPPNIHHGSQPDRPPRTKTQKRSTDSIPVTSSNARRCRGNASNACSSSAPTQQKRSRKCASQTDHSDRNAILTNSSDEEDRLSHSLIVLGKEEERRATASMINVAETVPTESSLTAHPVDERRTPTRPLGGATLFSSLTWAHPDVNQHRRKFTALNQIPTLDLGLFQLTHAALQRNAEMFQDDIYHHDTTRGRTEFIEKIVSMSNIQQLYYHLDRAISMHIEHRTSTKRGAETISNFLEDPAYSPQMYEWLIDAVTSYRHGHYSTFAEPDVRYNHPEGPIPRLLTAVPISLHFPGTQNALLSNKLQSLANVHDELQSGHARVAFLHMLDGVTNCFDKCLFREP